jgi:hypothetical protein
MGVKMKLKFLILSIVLIFLLSCVSAARKQAKIYESNLETMLGKEKEQVDSMIKEWDFEASNYWDAENPDVDTINNRSVSGFSKEEIQEIFSPKGKYSVWLFIKKVGTDSASTGVIDEYGKSLTKDTGYSVDRFTLIRTVFRDGELVNYKVFPNVSSTRISGTRVIRKD